MIKIEYAAYLHAGLTGPRTDYDTEYYQTQECKVYDAFIAGAMAPETEEFYRRKYSAICGEHDITPLPSPGDDEKLKEIIVIMLSEGHKLRAVKTWAEYHPGLGLKNSLAKINEFETLLKPIAKGDYYLSDTKRGRVPFICLRIDDVLDLVVGHPLDHPNYVDGRDRERCFKVSEEEAKHEIQACEILNEQD